MRRTTAFWTAVLLAALLPAAAAGADPAGRVQVVVSGRSEVVSDPIRLGEIARIEAADPEERGRLESVSLGRAPLPGRERRLDPAWIAARIRTAGVEAERLELASPEEVTVRRAAAVLERRTMEEAVREYVSARAGEEGVSRIREIRVPEALVVPAGERQLRVLGPKGGDLVGTVPLTLVVKAGEEPERRLPAAVTVERPVSVLVARRPLGRFKPLAEEDVERRPLDSTRVPADALTQPGEVIGKRVKRPVEAGAVLSADLLESQPVVKNGDRVRIVAETAGLRVTAFGVVRQRGAPGDLVQVVNLDSSKTVTARVVDERTVRIEF
ncbi:MAG: flagellar basal body P-ring formation chaperone FlgA [Desulfobacterales bacterium]